MKRILHCCVLIAVWAVLPPAQAGTKEDLLRLQNDVLQLQTQIRELDKAFNERTDGLKSLVVQLNDQVAKSGLVLDKIASQLEMQNSGTRSADETLIKEIRSLSGKIDDFATRISAMAQQLNELKVQAKTLNQESASGGGLSPDALYNQAYIDLVEGKRDLAIQEFTTYVERYPGGEKAASALLYIGDAHMTQNRLSEAISAFTRIVNEYPGASVIPSALFKRATAELARKESAEAIADLKNIVEKYPATPEAENAKNRLRELGVGTAKPAAKNTRQKAR